MYIFGLYFHGTTTSLADCDISKLDHHDLWRPLKEHIIDKPEGFFWIRKVKAHANLRDVEEGVTAWVSFLFV